MNYLQFIPSYVSSMKRYFHSPLVPLFLLAVWFGSPDLSAVAGWLNWRGPDQNGTFHDRVSLPDELDLESSHHRWSYLVRGGGTPVIADGRLYAFGYYGETGFLEETLLCLDAESGEKLWEHRFSDFISDIIYNRYGIGAPAIDEETGNVYVKSTNGLVMGFTTDGDLLWEHSLMEEFGMLTFPNGRTGAPVIEDDLVIVHGITANWSANGPARNRFYAFDKISGELVWHSTPGLRPIDSSFSTPVFGNLGDQRVFYAGTGCGNVVCINARTGEPVWRFQLAVGGVNSSMLLYGKDRLIAIHGKENVDSTAKGRLVSLKIPTEYPSGQLPLILGPEAEVWRNDHHVAFTSSPILVGNRVYSTIATGALECVDADTGETLWSEKLGPDQLHASPAYADGKIFAPMLDGLVHVLKPSDDGAEVLSAEEMGAPCLGAPAFYRNRVYIFSKQALHCFGEERATAQPNSTPRERENPGPIAQIQLVPAEFALAPGEKQAFSVYGLDAAGRRVREVTEEAEFSHGSPPGGRPSQADATLSGNVLTAGAQLSVGHIRASWRDHHSFSRGRIVVGYGYEENFDEFPLPLKDKDGVAVAPPPPIWLGAGPKWHIMEKGQGQAIANRLEVVLWQRTMNFMGKPSLRDYTFSAEVMTDGTRRVMSTVGLVNQRYLITLAANRRILEVTSNHERLKESVPFPVKPNTWYHLKTRVDAHADGSGVVRAKAWEKGQEEPSDWTIEVQQEKVHRQGAPAVYAFSPQSLKRVFIDNLSLTANP